MRLAIEFITEFEVMVISAGFEPTTPGLGIRCSILLSYETTAFR